MITLNNYIEKTSTGEVKFKEGTFEGNEFILYIENGDLTPLIYLAIFLDNNRNIHLKKLFIPNVPNADVYLKIQSIFNQQFCIQTEILTLGYFNNFDCSWNYTINHDFSPYIDKESAILFLNEEDKERYENLYNSKRGCQLINSRIQGDYKKITIITNSIHSENIKQINEICKELKEKYGVEYIELVATHCHIKEGMKNVFTGELYIDRSGLCRKYGNTIRYYLINKIITTNSTIILEPQKSKHLEVINCEEFFKNVAF